MANAFTTKAQNILKRLEALKESLQKKGAIGGRVKKGIDILEEMLANKQKLYAQYLKTPDVAKKEQILAIIQNQMALLEYFKKTALPELISVLNEMLVDLGFNTVPLASKLLTPMQRALQMADGRIDPQIQLLNSQLSFARLLEQESAMFGRSLEVEKTQMANFRAQFSEISSSKYAADFRDYAERLDRLRDSRVLKIAGAAAVFVLVPMAAFAGGGDSQSSTMDVLKFLTSNPLIIPLIVGMIAVLFAAVSMAD